MSRKSTLFIAAALVGLGLSGCADRKTTVRRETETTRSQPRVYEESTTVTPAPSEDTTVIERQRRTVEER
jgi:hypothetical protein